MALLSANQKEVKIEGPVCDSSQVIGWHLRKMNNESDTRPPIHISSFGFNSSILWDPERWGRPSAVQKYSQVYMPNHFFFFFGDLMFRILLFICIHLLFLKLIIESV
jgi:hypothetical protein